MAWSLKNRFFHHCYRKFSARAPKPEETLIEVSHKLFKLLLLVVVAIFSAKEMRRKNAKNNRRQLWRNKVDDEDLFAHFSAPIGEDFLQVSERIFTS